MSQNREEFLRHVADYCKQVEDESIRSTILPQAEGIANHLAHTLADSCCLVHAVLGLQILSSILLLSIANDVGIDIKGKGDEETTRRVEHIVGSTIKLTLTNIESVHALVASSFVILHGLAREIGGDCPANGVCLE